MGKRREARIRIAEEDGVLRVTIPMPRRWHHLVAFAVGAVGVLAWGVGNPVLVVGSFLGWPAVAPEPPQTYMPLAGLLFVLVPWLIMWLGGVAWFLFYLLWERYGREVLLIDNDTLTLRREEPLYASSERFDVDGVRQFRAVSRGAGYYLSLYPWASDIIYHPWHLAFEYGGHTIRFAGALDGGEAERIVREVAARVPSLLQVSEPTEGLLAPKPTVTDVAGGLGIVMPVRSRALGVVAVFAAAASYGSWMLLSGGPEAFPLLPGGRVVWLVHGILGLICAAGLWAYWVLWLLLGREVALIDGMSLTLKRVTPLYTRTKVFDLREVRGLRATPEPWSARTAPSRWTRVWLPDLATPGLAGGHLAFDYEGRTVHFGVGLDQARAQQIVDQIAARLPRVTETGG
jgi:hypothetical protein